MAEQPTARGDLVQTLERGLLSPRSMRIVLAIACLSAIADARTAVFINEFVRSLHAPRASLRQERPSQRLATTL
jgi:hypothetical protein